MRFASDVRRSLTALGMAAAVLASAAPRARAAEPVTVTTDLSKGGVTFSSGENSLSIGALIQFLWIGDDKEAFDADTSGEGVGVEDGFSSQFRTQRVRAILQGTMWKAWLKYKVEIEFASTSGESDNKVKDGYIEFAKHQAAAVRLGQFKVPFSLQQLTSDWRGSFIDRAVTDPKFAVSRDIGGMVSGTFREKALGYSAGVFNGGGESRSQDDESVLLAARVWFDPIGEYVLSEGALDNPEEMILHFGASARAGEAVRGTATPGVVEDPDDERALGAEAAWRWSRLWATAEYFRMRDEQQNPASGPDIASRGWFAQVTGMIVPKTFEMGGRYAVVDPDHQSSDDEIREVRMLGAFYIKGHHVKLQADAGALRYDAGFSALSPLARRNLPALGTRLGAPQEYTDRQYRFQAQLAF